LHHIFTKDTEVESALFEDKNSINPY
jgi:hypothetical protein